MREKLRSSNLIESPFAGRDGIDTWLIWVSRKQPLRKFRNYRRRQRGALASIRVAIGGTFDPKAISGLTSV
jgi:hypothetical protein